MKLNDPLFFREALRDYTEKTDKVGNNKRRIKQYAGKTKVEEIGGDAKVGDGEFKKVQCSVCDESRDLDNCSMFKDQKRKGSKILWKKKLCYVCYSPVSQDHNAKTCKQRRTWMICKQSDPTGFHGYLPKKKQPKLTSDPKDGVPPVDDKKLMTSNFAEMDIKCNSSSMESKIISMCVVPVKISHSKSKKEISTYAMLDNCSQGTFIKEDIQKKLGTVGREVDITVKTLNEEQSMKSTAVSGLGVSSSIASDKEIWLNLPPVYTREDIPVDIKEVATRENIKS